MSRLRSMGLEAQSPPGLVHKSDVTLESLWHWAWSLQSLPLLP